jgi:hypothetical protein
MFCAEPKRNESHGAAHTGRLERDALADPGASDFLATCSPLVAWPVINYTGRRSLRLSRPPAQLEAANSMHSPSRFNQLRATIAAISARQSDRSSFDPRNVGLVVGLD